MNYFETFFKFLPQIPGDPERADQPDDISRYIQDHLDVMKNAVCHFYKIENKIIIDINLKIKKMISMPLIMENPVRSPMVPPMRLSWASVLIFSSLSMSSKVAVSK